MAESDRSSLGEMRATISKEIVRLQAEYYGKGPTRAKTYIVEDLVVIEAGFAGGARRVTAVALRR